MKLFHHSPKWELVAGRIIKTHIIGANINKYQMLTILAIKNTAVAPKTKTVTTSPISVKIIPATAAKVSEPRSKSPRLG